MKYRSIFNQLFCIVVLISWCSCSYQTTDQYILPNGYQGFFGVLYQADERIEQLEESGVRIFNVSKAGVCESGFDFARGPVIQKFRYQDGKNLLSFDFTLFYQMTDHEIDIIKRNHDQLFAICFYSVNINGGENNLAIYIIAKGAEILHLQKNSEKLFFYLNGMSFNWQENKDNMITNIARLNKELADKKPPFD